MDNLAPTAPQNLAMAGSGILSWDEAGETDFDYFTVYGSESPTLDGTAVVISHTTQPGLDVSSNPAGYLHVTATDFAGNESAASTR